MHIVARKSVQAWSYRRCWVTLSFWSIVVRNALILDAGEYEGNLSGRNEMKSYHKGDCPTGSWQVSHVLHGTDVWLVSWFQTLAVHVDNLSGDPVVQYIEAYFWQLEGRQSNITGSITIWWDSSLLASQDSDARFEKSSSLSESTPNQ